MCAGKLAKSGQILGAAKAWEQEKQRSHRLSRKAIDGEYERKASGQSVYRELTYQDRLVEGLEYDDAACRLPVSDEEAGENTISLTIDRTHEVPKKKKTHTRIKTLEIGLKSLEGVVPGQTRSKVLFRRKVDFGGFVCTLPGETGADPPVSLG